MERKTSFKKCGKRITAIAAAVALAVSFTFPAEMGEGYLSFGNSITASADDYLIGNYLITTNDPDCYTIVDNGDGHSYIVLSSGANVTISGSDTRYSIRIAENAVNVRLTLYDCSVLKEAASWKNAIELSAGSSAEIILMGVNNIQGGRESSAIRVPEGASLTISGTGTLNASINNSGSTAYSAVIGSQYTLSCGNITINGGTINANSNSNSAASIGTAYWTWSNGNGGEGTSNGTITLNGGTINANKIGGVNTSENCTVTGSGAAIVNSSDIKADTSGFNGIVFNGNSATVYGDAIVEGSLEIPADAKLFVPDDASITVTDSGSLDVSGNIVLDGTIQNNGTISGSGKIVGEASDITGNGNCTITPAPCTHPESSLSYIPIDENQHKVYCNDCLKELGNENHSGSDCSKCGFSTTGNKCGDNAYYIFDSSTGTLTIIGSGAIYDSPSYTCNYRNVKKIVIESGITGIGERAFFNFMYVESISIPDTVTDIGSKAFITYGNKLQMLVIPESVTNMSTDSIFYCYGTVVLLPDRFFESVNKNNVKSVVGYETQTVDGEQKAVVLSVSNGNAVIPESINGKEVYIADEVLKDYPDVFHDHREKTAATCTEKALCAICLTNYGEIDPDNHSFTSYVSNDNATCTENGTETAECDNCDATDTREIEDSALGHSYGAPVFNWAEDNTCKAVFTCERDSTHILEKDCEVSVKTSTDAVCETGGSVTYTAKVTLDNTEYSDQKNVDVPAKGHTIVKIEKREPTCTEDGNIQYYKCSVCGKFFSDSEGKNEITLADTVISALGHSFENGVCTICGAADNDYVSKAEEAAETVKNALAGFTASNSTTAEDILEAAQNAAGDGVTITVSSIETVPATIDRVGSITVVLTVTDENGFTETVKAVFTINKLIKPASESVSVIYYPIVINGNVFADKSSAQAGETVDVKTEFGYDIIVTDGNGRKIAKIDRKGSFVMPASKVNITAVMNETLGLMSNAWSHSYVYSYDSDMNKIKVNSDSKRGVVVIDLGADYAGREFVIYSGRKSTKTEVISGTLDRNGRFTFKSDEGKNYTLVVS